MRSTYSIIVGGHEGLVLLDGLLAMSVDLVSGELLGEVPRERDPLLAEAEDRHGAGLAGLMALSRYRNLR